MARGKEIRGETRPDHYALIKEASEFVGQCVFRFCLTAGLEKARQVLIDKEEFESSYQEKVS